MIEPWKGQTLRSLWEECERRGAEIERLRAAIAAVHQAAARYALHPGATDETALFDSIDEARRALEREEP